MRYRITIDPATAKWYVEVDSFLGHFWTPIHKHFDSYYDAIEWVRETGLHEAYAHQDTKCLTTPTGSLRSKGLSSPWYVWGRSVRPDSVN